MSKPGAVQVDVHADAKVLGTQLHAVRLVELIGVAGRVCDRHERLETHVTVLTYGRTLGYGLYRCCPNET